MLKVDERHLTRLLTLGLVLRSSFRRPCLGLSNRYLCLGELGRQKDRVFDRDVPLAHWDSLEVHQIVTQEFQKDGVAYLTL